MDHQWSIHRLNTIIINSFIVYQLSSIIINYQFISSYAGETDLAEHDWHVQSGGRLCGCLRVPSCKISRNGGFFMRKTGGNSWEYHRIITKQTWQFDHVTVMVLVSLGEHHSKNICSVDVCTSWQDFFSSDWRSKVGWWFWDSVLFGVSSTAWWP